jgi:hypothetical protein
MMNAESCISSALRYMAYENSSLLGSDGATGQVFPCVSLDLDTFIFGVMQTKKNLKMRSYIPLECGRYLPSDTASHPRRLAA